MEDFEEGVIYWEHLPAQKMPTGEELKQIKKDALETRKTLKASEEFESVENVDTGEILTSAQWVTRRNLKEKKIRAFRRLRGILAIQRIVRWERTPPIVKKFQKVVRRVFMAIHLFKEATRKRHFPTFSNPKV